MIKPGFSKYEGRIVERLLNASEGAKLAMIGQLQPSDEFNKSFYKIRLFKTIYETNY